MKTILVTGGAGFIGSNFCRYILEKDRDCRLLVLDSLTYAGDVDALGANQLDERADRVKFWYGNVRNADLVATLVEQADIVVHFAAETHVTRSIFDNAVFYETDVMGTQTIVNSVIKAKNVKLMIHISTSEVYGTAISPLMDENHPLNPRSPYASAKCGGDRLIYSYWETYGAPCVIIRPFNVFGPRQHLEKLIPRFITSVILGEPLTIHGDGSAARDFTYVGDICRAIHRVMGAPREQVLGEVFNVASGVGRSIVEIADDVRRLMGKAEAAARYVPERPGQVSRHAGDAAKIKRVLGWQPEESWESGLQKSIEWYLANRAWWERRMWARTVSITSLDGQINYY
ncbi:MAG TPA: GDP-mannose 4,6-dehydratase [Candidatus Sulfotelmatobacter sp.]|nr:GDP-mannose 4,6-dehydratase [Candidatus Sulfotelmatobacter sp.]